MAGEQAFKRDYEYGSDGRLTAVVTEEGTHATPTAGVAPQPVAPASAPVAAGAPAPVAAPAPAFCTGCGTSLKPGARFCAKCGKPLG